MLIVITSIFFKYNNLIRNLLGLKIVECNLCKEEYADTHIEFHLVGVHGVAGPKEMYISESISEMFSETTISK